MLKCVNKQLVDFLPGGKFCNPENAENLAPTEFAHVTNLACEHHFGDLDSSQRRRPDAPMHHHSSVQLLKRNRQSMMNWLDQMPHDDRAKIIKTSCKGGRELREEHINNEREVVNEIHSEMNLVKTKTVRKTTRIQNQSESDEENYDIDITARLPQNEAFVISEYVIVAYNDNWYPGCVVELKNEKHAYVTFMTHCGNLKMTSS
ncbi:hypothetical protein SNE40_018161 [Patella caerulea]|uniref:Uncharacterized protein n=1 Tax=Patella caerulea TaxID=87958 RepID=A0AAN8JBA8_PATCE